MIRNLLRWFMICGVLALCGVVALAQDSPSAKPSAGRAADEESETNASESNDKPADSESAGDSRDDLPLASETPLPSVEELLSGERRDWVILTDDRLLIVEPVYPRPNTLKQMDAEHDAIYDDPSRRYSDEGRQRLKELRSLNIFLPGDEGASREYRLSINNVREVVHHEDLMLRRAKELIAAGKTREAFELVIVVARTDPQWPGLLEVRNQLAVADAERFLDDGRTSRALAIIAALYEQDPVPKSASKLFEQAADALVEAAVDADDGRQARFALGRVRQVDPEHPAVARWTQTLIEHAQSLREQARAAAGEGNHASAAMLIEQAAEFWPPLKGLKADHARLTEQYQILTVAVPALAPPEPLAISTIAGRRISRLRHADLFELDGFTTLPSYRSNYLERWKPDDLGRRAHFELRSQLPPWAARDALTGAEVIDLLSARFDPNRPEYDARFASIVAALRLTGPYEFEVVFQRIPHQTEAALAFNAPLDPSISDRLAAAFLRFRETARIENSVRYARAAPPPADGPGAISQVVEIAYPSYEKAIQALDRGDVRMLVDVPVWDIPRLREEGRFVVKPLAVPRTHLIQFHPESKALKSTELRRALAASANAAELLRIVAGAGSEEFGRLVTAPYPSTHLGYDELVPPNEPDLALALALTLAAEKELGGAIPPLVLAIPPQSPAREAAVALAENWRRIGLKIELIEFEEIGPSSQWDLAYRGLAVADPVRSLGPLITLDPAVEIESLSDLPDWLRQRLLDLERASDPSTTRAILLDLHSLLAADVRCIPLFEIDRAFVTRGAIAGLPEDPVAVYQDTERWRLPQEYPAMSVKLSRLTQRLGTRTPSDVRLESPPRRICDLTDGAD